MVTSNFVNHKTYQWALKRARALATFNPEIITETIDLIHDYSDRKDPKVYLLSKYDNLIPFLAERYSAMPIFDLSAYMLSKREFNEAKRVIQEGHPVYLFIDRNLLDKPNDPWAVLYRNMVFKSERASRLERYELLQKIFLEFKEEYEKVEERGLLAVYKRKTQ